MLPYPDVYEERPLRVADPHGSRWKVGSPSPRATVQQSTLISRAVPPNLGAEGCGQFNITLRIWLALGRHGLLLPSLWPHFSSEQSPWITGGAGKVSSAGMFLPQVAFWEYMQIPPRLHRSVLVLNDALSLYASLYLIRQETIHVTSSSLHTGGHPRPGIGPPLGPSQVPWCSGLAGSTCQG